MRTPAVRAAAPSPPARRVRRDMPLLLSRGRLPNMDMEFFLDEEGVLRSHANTFGKVAEERYKEGGTSEKTFKGITTTVTYHWEARRYRRYTVTYHGRRAITDVTCRYRRYAVTYHWEAHAPPRTRTPSWRPHSPTLTLHGTGQRADVHGQKAGGTGRGSHKSPVDRARRQDHEGGVALSEECEQAVGDVIPRVDACRVVAVSG